MHAVDGRGMLVIRKALRRDALLAWFAAQPPCVILMEACGGAHHWARELTRQGHTVRIIAAEFVKPFRKSGKNDANDAEAICTAVRQPNMRFVPMKSVPQQAALCVHRLRQGLVEERTALINRLRELLTEFGVVAPLSPEKLRRELRHCLDEEKSCLPPTVRQLVRDELAALDPLEQRIASYAEQIAAQVHDHPQARRLQGIAGVGPLTAAAVVTRSDSTGVSQRAPVASWLGLVPKQHSTVGNTRLVRITRRGDSGLTAGLGSGPTRRIGIGNEETKTNSHKRPRSREEGAVSRPPIQQGASRCDAKERCAQARDDDEYAKDAKSPWCA